MRYTGNREIKTSRVTDDLDSERLICNAQSNIELECAQAQGSNWFIIVFKQQWYLCY